MPTYREIHIVRIASDPPALFCSSVIPRDIPADDVIGPEPQTALGAGNLVNIPDFQQLINGVSESVEITVSSVSAQTLIFAIEESPSIYNARVDIGVMPCDSLWQQSGPVVWEFNGRAKTVSVVRGAADSQRIPTRALTLTIEHGDTVRSRAPTAFFTDADQHRRSPTDDIFSHVAGINAGTSRRFAPADA